MRGKRMFGATTLGIALLVAGGGLWTWQSITSVAAQTAAAPPDVAVGPQYDTTHVYLAPEQFDRFVSSLLATFGGTAAKQGVFTVTPTPSSTMSQLVLTPVGSTSVFGFKTPVPYPFGVERTGYLVKDLDEASRPPARQEQMLLLPSSTIRSDEAPSFNGPAGSICSSTGTPLRPLTSPLKLFQRIGFMFPRTVRTISLGVLSLFLAGKSYLTICAWIPDPRRRW